jgi:excisionase family DNA binding protein
MDKLLTVKNVCVELRVHENTVYTWLQSGQLPAMKIRKGWLIKERELRKLIKKGPWRPLNP